MHNAAPLPQSHQGLSAPTLACMPYRMPQPLPFTQFVANVVNQVPEQEGPHSSTSMTPWGHEHSGDGDPLDGLLAHDLNSLLDP